MLLADYQPLRKPEAVHRQPAVDLDDLRATIGATEDVADDFGTLVLELEDDAQVIPVALDRFEHNRPPGTLARTQRSLGLQHVAPLLPDLVPEGMVGKLRHGRRLRQGQVTGQQMTGARATAESYRGTQEGDDEVSMPVDASRHFAFPWCELRLFQYSVGKSRRMWRFLRVHGSGSMSMRTTRPNSSM